MFPDQHFITNGMLLSCCIFKSCPEHSVCISSVHSFPELSEGSQIFFPVLLGVGS